MLFHPTKCSLAVALLCLAPLKGIAGYSQNGDGLVIMEAEKGALSGSGHNWDIQDDTSASQSRSILSTGSNWSAGQGQSQRFDFTIANGGSFDILLRSKVSGGQAYVKLNGAYISANSNGAIYPGATSSWTWTDANDNLRNVTLSPGSHQLELFVRTGSLAVDRVALVPSGSTALVDGSANVGPPETLVGDEDGDGVPDSLDQCPGTPVGVAVGSDGCPVQGGGYVQNGDGLVVMEAENGTLSSGGHNWDVQGDSSASQSKAIQSTGSNWSAGQGQSQRFNFTITSGGTFNILLRSKVAGGQAYVKLNDSFVSANSNGAIYPSSTSTWTWTDANDNLRNVALSPGSHQIELFVRTGSLGVDKIALVPTSSAVLVDGSTGVGPGETTGNPATDSDGDGVPDSRDECPGTPLGIAVDSRGCAVESRDYGAITDFSRFPGSEQFGASVTLPNCDASDAVSISQPSQLSLIETSSARVFCIQPGDYRSAGQKTITSSGSSKANPKMIVLDTRDIPSMNVDSVIFDDSDSDKRAYLPPLKFLNADNWILDRMAFVDLDPGYGLGNWLAAPIPVLIDNSDNVVVSRVLVAENLRGVNLHDGSDGVFVQNSLFIRSDASKAPADSACVGLVDHREQQSPPWNPASITDFTLANNEMKNCVDGVQLVWNEGKDVFNKGADQVGAINRPSYYSPENWADYSGALIAGNDIYVTKEIRASCDYSVAESGICSFSENAVDIKSGAWDSTRPVQIKNNRFWGFRKADRKPGSDGKPELSDTGSAVVVHFVAARNIEVSRNLIWDSSGGVFVNTGASNVAVNENLIVDTYSDGDGSCGHYVCIRGYGNNGRAIDVEASYHSHHGGNVQNISVDDNVVSRRNSQIEHGYDAHIRTSYADVARGACQRIHIGSSSERSLSLSPLSLNTLAPASQSVSPLTLDFALPKVQGCLPSRYWVDY